jgi:hypothetical protein
VCPFLISIGKVPHRLATRDRSQSHAALVFTYVVPRGLCTSIWLLNRPTMYKVAWAQQTEIVDNTDLRFRQGEVHVALESINSELQHIFARAVPPLPGPYRHARVYIVASKP